MIGPLRTLRERRGQALVGMALGMVAFSAFAVATVDLARLGFTANEVQTLADISATAGVRALLDGQSAVTAAQQTAAANRVDGQAGAINPPGTVVVGTYNPATGAFTAGGASPNAVQANAEKTVTNFMAAAIGFSQTKVTKTAIATFTTLGTAKATLPLALGSCFTAGCVSQSCLPLLSTQANNIGWTGFTSGANTSTIGGFFPSPCGSGNAIPTITTGTPINLTNAVSTPLFNAVQCMVCTLGINEFTVPVVQTACGSNMIQSSPVIGFATIKITNFEISGNRPPRLCGGGGGSIKGIFVSSLFRDAVPGPPGGTCTGCGTGYVTMVN